MLDLVTMVLHGERGGFRDRIPFLVDARGETLWGQPGETLEDLTRERYAREFAEFLGVPVEEMREVVP